MPARTKSNISHCHVVPKKGEKACLFYFPDKPKPGAAYVNLVGYLICPLNMFTERQIKIASKKYHARGK